MKKAHLVTMSALLFSVGGVNAQDSAYTKPVGYVTHTLKAGQFNLVGITVHNPIEVTGAFTFVATNGTGRVFDSGVDFSTVLTDDVAYVLEITSGVLAGTVQEVIRASGDAATRLVTADDLSADGLATGDTYQIRAASTLNDIFGEDNTAGLTESASINDADVLWLVNSTGGFDKYFYSPGGGFGGGTEGWKDSGGEAVEDVSMFYTDAFFVQSRSTADVELVISGSVKTNASTTIAIDNGFNFISTTYPVRTTLQDCGIEENLIQASTISSADVVWVSEGDTYNKYYYNAGGGFGGSSAGWKDSDGADLVGDIELTSGIIVQRRSTAVNVDIASPTDYTEL